MVVLNWDTGRAFWFTGSATVLWGTRLEGVKSITLGYPIKLVVAKVAYDINGIFLFRNTQLFRVTQKTRRNKYVEGAKTVVKMRGDYL